MSALNTTGEDISVLLAGTIVPLPSEQVLTTFTVDAADEVFTVPETGLYFLSYDVKLTAAAILSSQILRNGASLPGSVVSPALALDEFSSMQIVSLDAGDTIAVQLFGLLGLATLQSGNGASLTMIRLS